MLPYVIVHNEISIDGAMKDFKFNLELFYRLGGRYKADIFLVGSKTAKSGIEMFMPEVPAEEKSDFEKRSDAGFESKARWIIPDTKGIMEGLLHVYRRMEYCGDVVVLVSQNTPKSYLSYLKERNYDYIEAGEDRIDFKNALALLSDRYRAKKIVTDSGGEMTSALMEQGLVDELSLLVSPSIVGKGGVNLFRFFEPGENGINLQLVKHESFENDYLWMVYKVIK